MIMSMTTCGDKRWALHLNRWDQGGFLIFCYAKYTKTAFYLADYSQVILMKRLTSDVQPFKRVRRLRNRVAGSSRTRNETGNTLVLHRLRMRNTSGNYKVYICRTSTHRPKRKDKEERE